MQTPDQARDLAQDLVARAIAAGASAADAVFACDASTDVQIRLGALEDVQRSESAAIGLRVFDGRRSASVSGADVTAAGLATLAERAVAMARLAPEDAYAGLAPEGLLVRGPLPALDLDDDMDPDPALLRDLAERCEAAARDVTGVTNSEGGSAGAVRSVMALATSHGFVGSYGGSRYGIGASVLAGGEGAMERDSASHTVRFLEDLDTPEAVGRKAGERAVARLGAGKITSGPMPVVFDPRAGGSLIGSLIGAISGGAIARKTSFLLDKRGKPVFDSAVSIVDDPHRVRGLRSRSFDGEGLPTKAWRVIDKGVLTGWMMDSAAARQLGEAPTGHAARGISGAPATGASNLHMEAGSDSPTALMAGIATGIYVTELIGMGVNGVTGDYSRGASGFVIRNGQLAEPISEITIAGNLIDMFANLTPANDLDFRYAVNVPTLRIDGMVVASS
ncbi:TldD/PmbA family protein [Blastomonas sp.]|uniref:TldD/PmbA family protein n=1 Tax=Blastomonas sp. TaxID=1909299 RepID=UPI00260D81F3|nr:TldD/PmbA family protein [Blastomonas sp.]MDM7955805.1 TldD/PmbA family protein [Blastomonas sp.]